MTFVRLAGCNALELGLGCTSWCDTSGSWDPAAGEELTVEEVVERIGLPRLCLTGGEPLLQMDGVAELVTAAQGRGVRVHLETNGTVGPLASATAPADAMGLLAGTSVGHIVGFDWVVVSPKPPGYVIAPGWEDLVDELKLVVDDHLDAATAERLAAAHPGAFVSIQPQFSDDPRGAGPGPGTAERAVALVMSHPEWRLSLQTHKFLGIR
jgi:7-carboxy-7-deazaguanine synthase